MEHNLFKPKSLEEAKHSVVGDCNGISMQERWEKETPIFAKRILDYAKSEPGFTILDYGCGCGRIAKEILSQNPHVTVIGLDVSPDELKLAKEYVNDSRFIPILTHELVQKADLVYSIYCLQHVPAIELREVLQRIHSFLKDDGIFIYCSSDYRMAVRFDAGGFFDDRFLGVNIREEISRFFQEEGELFPSEYDLGDRATQQIIRKMVKGLEDGLPHPAKVFKKRQIAGHLFNAQLPKAQIKQSEIKDNELTQPKRLILRNRLSPGDILVMSVAIRALHKAHPGKFLTDVDTPCNYIFENNPYISKLNGDGQLIDMQYPEIHKSGASGRHFVDGHRKYLEDVLEIKIPRVGLLPDIFLNQDEQNWVSPVVAETGYEGKYWVINAGCKSDYPLKQYHRWQEVVYAWKKEYPDIQLVQIGQSGHQHAPLEGVLDMRGKTEGRKLFRAIHHAEGVLTCVSFPMHAAAALEKPCVVVAGGREPVRWEMYGNHRFLATNGALDCCLYNGCWKNTIEDCKHPVEMVLMKSEGGFEKGPNVPLCHEMIRPEDIVRAMELFYIGGVLNAQEMVHV